MLAMVSVALFISEERYMALRRSYYSICTYMLSIYIYMIQGSQMFQILLRVESRFLMLTTAILVFAISLPEAEYEHYPMLLSQHTHQFDRLQHPAL